MLCTEGLFIIQHIGFFFFFNPITVFFLQSAVCHLTIKAILYDFFFVIIIGDLLTSK